MVINKTLGVHGLMRRSWWVAGDDRAATRPLICIKGETDVTKADEDMTNSDKGRNDVGNDTTKVYLTHYLLSK